MACHLYNKYKFFSF